MSDGFLTLAQTQEGTAMLAAPGLTNPCPTHCRLSIAGVSCFVVPRWLPNSRGRNVGFQLQRLKDKLGDKSNASSEVEYRAATGQYSSYQIMIQLILLRSVCLLIRESAFTAKDQMIC